MDWCCFTKKATDGTPMYYVGNPLFQEWFRIPLPPFLSLQDLKILRNRGLNSDSGLVTKMQSGIVVSYKVVFVMSHGGIKVGFAIYSSDTWTWETRHVTCLDFILLFGSHKSIALNGILHWIFYRDGSGTRSILAYDFYGGHDDILCSIVDFPDTGEVEGLSRFTRTITTSEGSIVYFNEFVENGNRTLRVWRLVTYTDVDPEAWQLFWEVSLEPLIEFFGVVISQCLYEETAENSKKCMDGCILSFNECSEYMQRYYIPLRSTGIVNHLFSQYVLPRWLQRLPRPQPT
ncbi:PREDICTED: putative F-box protein At3g23950 [Camelina sativa]|uniref:F-box protein At3g23950 n=1 Tax=Camelina sativa TaxID=90675 RepID=A0ABM0XRZ8_CAMSA|nr:PREDICTED: putative F-box protein At3g23950 [Camelina sativa]